jgi:very-short-patch-repair endonuclease
MTPSIDHPAVWTLVRAQHGVIARPQLLHFGFSAEAIKHRLTRGRLRLIWRGVYAVGQLPLTKEGRFMAAVLAGGTGAALSHESAAALWGIRKAGLDPIDISRPGNRVRLEGIRAHRRNPMPATTTLKSISVTQPLFTLVDLAASLHPRALEAAVNETDKLRLVAPAQTRKQLAEMPRTPGLGLLEAMLGVHKRTDSDLERAFLRLVRKAGLPLPKTQKRANGHRVDFHWPELGLVVETDGSAYQRTPMQQMRDRQRDQAHTKAGLTPLRFAELQIDYYPDEVVETLRALIAQKRQQALLVEDLRP